MSFIRIHTGIVSQKKLIWQYPGIVCAVSAERVTPVQVSIQEVAVVMKRLGKGIEKLNPGSEHRV